MIGADRLKLLKRGGVLDVNREGFLFILCENKGRVACVELLRKETGVWEECVKILEGVRAILEIGGGVRPELYKVLGGNIG